ncbi:hypothetical protein [Mycolicibacterium palauense]|uniref:hypothetical protein n=1 Tax=Mycolicibacterium palauense TaxID=2034511 RepID=UPI0011452FAF|nr:hypothetical protein [Mycolicibacterium palauense]
MSDHSYTGNDVPDDLNAGGNTEGETGAPDEAVVEKKRPGLHPLALFPLLLGALVCLLNLYLLLRFWRFLWSARWDGAVALSLVTMSLLIGIFLILYAFVLPAAEVNRAQDASDTATNDTATHGDRGELSRYLKWIVAPLVLALVAPLISVWAIQTVSPDTPEPTAPKPCIELYQEALTIREGNPNFRMPNNDPDQRRCRINQSVLQPARPQ